MAKQWIKTISKKNGTPKGVAINKNSIGNIYVNGEKHSYNLDKMNTPENPNASKFIFPSDFKNKAEQKKKKLLILIKRK